MLEIKSKKFRRQMEKEGLGHIHLYKNRDYFFFHSDILTNLDYRYSTSVFVSSFRELEIEEWIEILKDMLNEENLDL